jgi:hypothetical protein
MDILRLRHTTIEALQPSRWLCRHTMGHKVRITCRLLAHRVIRGIATLRSLSDAKRTFARPRDWFLLVHLIPVRPRVGAQMAAALAPQPRAEREPRHVVGIGAHVENPKVIAALAEAPRGERLDAVGAHVAEGHWSYRLHRERGDFRVDPSDESSCEDGGVEIWTREHSSYRADFEPNQLDGDFHRS